MTSFRRFSCLPWTYFTLPSTVSIADFKQVHFNWDECSFDVSLTYLALIFYFYTPWKRLKPSIFKSAGSIDPWIFFNVAAFWKTMRKFCDIAFFGTFKIFFTWNKPFLLFTDALYCHKIITLKNNMNGILCFQLYCYQTVNEVSPFLAVDTCSLRIINLKGSFDHKL